MYLPHQLKSVYGWHALSNLWNDGRFMPLLTTSRVFGFNPDTAPAEILTALAGKDNTPLTQEILRLRRTNRLLAAEKTLALIRARSLSSDSVSIFPSNSIRITQQSEAVPWALEISLMLTPMLDSSPWRVDYYAKTRLRPKSPEEVAVPLPPASSIPVLGVDAPGAVVTGSSQKGVP